MVSDSDRAIWELPKIGDPYIYYIIYIYRERESTLNGRILIIGTPKYGTPSFQELPYCHRHDHEHIIPGRRLPN